MSVTFFRTADPSAQECASPCASETQDLDPTTDFHEERTTDLAAPHADALSTTDLPAATTAASVDVAPAGHDEDSAYPAAMAESPPAVADAASVGPCAQRSAPTLCIGAQLHERYLIEELIGSGGVSIVYRARDLHAEPDSAQALVALKTPRPELHDHARARARLAHEHQHTRALSHPNIVRVFDLYTDSDPCFMTMELLQGRLLSRMMSDAQEIPAPFAHRILQGCARALAHAHAHGVVHGDFKPGNVFVTREDVVKIIDFGAAATLQTVRSRIAAGTPAYASPEVLSGAAPQTPDDVFSFACVAYELLTGQHPFARRSSVQAREENLIPPRAWRLSSSQWLALRAALSWRREQRPAGIEALMTALAPDPPQPAGDAPRRGRRDRFEDMLPRRRSWGFFLFIACAFAVTWLADRRQTERVQQAPAVADASTDADAHPAAREAPPTASLAHAPLGRMSAFSHPGLSGAPAPTPADLDPVTAGSGSQSATPQNQSPPAKTPTAPRRSVAGSEIAFQSAHVVTSESSVAAVFIVKRSPPLTGRAGVRWRSIAGTAEPGVDFAADASGSIEFADGQAQRAIYVPLRNDSQREGPQTFTIELHSPRNAQLGSQASAQATILDDD